MYIGPKRNSKNEIGYCPTSLGYANLILSRTIKLAKFIERVFNCLAVIGQSNFPI